MLTVSQTPMQQCIETVTEVGDYAKLQENENKQYIVFIVLPDCRLQQCVNGSSSSDGDRLADAELIFSVYEKHYPVVMYECNPGGVMRAVKRNY